MATRIVLDGGLISECEILGANRHGMLRLAEEVTSRIIKDRSLDIAFANTIYEKKYDSLLRRAVDCNYPSHSGRIISKVPRFASDIPILRKALRGFSRSLFLDVILDGLGDYDIFHSFFSPFPRQVRRNAIKKSISYLDIIPLRMAGYADVEVHRTRKIVKDIVPNFAISISEFSKTDLLDYEPDVDPARVFVATLAASTELFFPNRDRDQWVRVKRKYGLPENYFLSVSSNNLRKNIPHLIKSFSTFVLQQKPKDLCLVLTGNFNYSRAILDDLNISPEVKERIWITDTYIDNVDLSVVYGNALCFFFMSLYEGFGLPVLEAMQCGTPVVTSNTTSLPELVDSAGLMVSPTDEEALCEVMYRIYEDSNLRATYADRGLQRAKQFSWDRCAETYAGIFTAIGSNR